MNELYPLKFKPLFLDKIWGGQRIRTTLGLDFGNLPNCGEAWVLSGVKGSETQVSNGFLKGNNLNELLEVYMDDLVGEKSFEKYPDQFPILVKFIDSNDYLSVQVHPDDALATRRRIGNGKNELWFILEAEAGAELISGFIPGTDQNDYLDRLRKNRLKEILNVEKVGKGDVFYIPSGHIHALGPGILLAEIQQTSDITYRIYDWDRKDKVGISRELHTDLALEAIDFGNPGSNRITFRDERNKTQSLLESPQFDIHLLSFDQPVMKDYSMLDSFVILLCLEGTAEVIHDTGNVPFTAGEAVLLPAVIENIGLVPLPGCRLLEVYIA